MTEANKLKILDTIYNENKDKIKNIPPHPFDTEKANLWLNSQPAPHLKEFCALFIKYQIHVSGQDFLESIAKLGADIISRMLKGKYSGIIVCLRLGSDRPYEKSNFWVLLLLYPYLKQYIVSLFGKLNECYDYILEKNHKSEKNDKYLIILPDDMSYSGTQLSDTFGTEIFNNYYLSTLISSNDDEYDLNTDYSKSVDKIIGDRNETEFNNQLIKKILKLKPRNKKEFLKLANYNEKDALELINKFNNGIYKSPYDKEDQLTFKYSRELSGIIYDLSKHENKVPILKERYSNVCSNTDILIAVPYISSVAKTFIIKESQECASIVSLSDLPIKFSEVTKIIVPFDEFLKIDGFEFYAIPRSFISVSTNNQAIYFDHKLAGHLSSWTLIYDFGPISDPSGSVTIKRLGSLIKNCGDQEDYSTDIDSRYDPKQSCPRGYYKGINYTYLDKKLTRRVTDLLFSD